MSPAESVEFVWRFAAYVGAIAAHHPINLVVKRLYGRVSSDDEVSNDYGVPEFVGFVERPLYVAALQYDAVTSIAAWFVLKVAGKWNPWSEDAKRGTDGAQRPSGRNLYNIFLVGNGLSLGLAAASFWSAGLAGDGLYWQAALVLVGAFGGTYALAYRAREV